MAICKFCQKEITWIKEGKKNTPIEGDGGVHACPEKEASMKSIKKIEVKSLSKEEIKRYEDSINAKVKAADERKRRARY